MEGAEEIVTSSRWTAPPTKREIRSNKGNKRQSATLDGQREGYADDRLKRTSKMRTMLRQDLVTYAEENEV